MPRRSLVFRILMAGIWCVLFPHATAHACSPAPPTPWFTEQLTFSEVALPPGVTLRTTNSRTIVLANSSHTPLYVIGKLDIGGNEYERLPVAFPADTGPLHKLINGQVFTWGPMIVDQDQPPVLAWDKDWSDGSGLAITAWPDAVSAGRGPIASVLQRNQTGDNRPATVALPPPQQTELTLVYGDQRLVVPLTISYALNQAYDPHSVSRAANACRSLPLFGLLLAVSRLGCIAGLGGSVVLVVLYMALKRAQRV